MNWNETLIKTPLGTIVITPNGSRENPGVWIDLRREGCECDAPLALVEYTADEADLNGGNIISRVWENVCSESYTGRIVHDGIEAYFENENK